MSEIQNCKRCGNMFQSNGFISVCPDCKSRDDQDFDKIRMYLFEHRLAKIFEVSSILDIPVNRIRRFLREGRLEIAEKDNHFLLCELCGKPIQSGRHCDECATQLKHDYKSFYSDHFGGKQEPKISFLSRGSTNSGRRLATR